MDDVQNEPQSFDIQNDSAPAPEQETPSTEATDDQSGGDVSQEPKIVFDDAQQGKVNELIGGKVAKQRAAEQRAEAAEQKLALYESQQPKPKAPDVPDMPDPDAFYGDDAGLQAAYAARDEAIEKRAEFNAEQRNAEKQTTADTQQQAFKVAQKRAETDNKYVENGKSFGLELQTMQQDGQSLSQSGLSPQVQDFIHQNEQGPLISNYLASNILELDNLRQMSPLDASVHIANEIKPKLAGIKQQTKTPRPADIIDGQGVPEKEDPRLAGVTYS